MATLFSGENLLAAGGTAVLLALSVMAANAYGGSHDGGIRLSDRPKTIVIDNLNTALFTKGDAATAAVAQQICGDCHSSDYPTTQAKLTCDKWASEIVKMGNTFRASIPWQEDGVSYGTLNQILTYLADNYGEGSASCDPKAMRAIPGLID